MRCVGVGGFRAAGDCRGASSRGLESAEEPGSARFARPPPLDGRRLGLATALGRNAMPRPQRVGGGSAASPTSLPDPREPVQSDNCSYWFRCHLRLAAPAWLIVNSLHSRGHVPEASCLHVRRYSCR